jgi:ribulose-bisphosphate carboxylase large chain
MRSPLHGVPAAMPVPAGGMTVERVAELVGFYGRDAMLLIGGSLLVVNDLYARTCEFVEAVAEGGRS